MKAILAAVAAALLLASASFAATPLVPAVPGVKAAPAGTEPVDIKADATEYRGKDNLVIFIGNVVAVQGTVTINADRLEVELEKETREIKEIRALGNVSVRREDMLATGAKAVFSIRDDSITLTGAPKIWRGPDAVEGDTVIMFIKDERIEVKGQARVVLNPPAKKKDAPK